MTPERRAEFDDLRAILHQTKEILHEAQAQLLTHANMLADHDERMDRAGRHLEALIERQRKKG